MAQDFRDFKDIQDAIMDQLKYQQSDTVSRSRIKRDINMIYDQVIMFKKWWWAKGQTAARIEPFVNDGTVTATEDSTTITFSTAPTTSKTNHYINISASLEVYRITAHTANSTTATIEVAYTEVTTTSSAYKMWNPVIDLPTDCREVDVVWTDFLNEPLRAEGPAKIRELMAATRWTVQGRPRHYAVLDYFTPTTPEVEADRIRQLLVHPAILDRPTQIKIDYIKENSSLDADTDEPIMPIEDRMVLYYGACAEAWHRERDPEAAARYDVKFQQRLAQMAGKQQDSMDTMKLHSSKIYLDGKRRSQKKNFPFAEANIFSDCSEDKLVVFEEVSLNDNQIVPQAIITENKKALFVKYHIRRGNGNAETGEIFIAVPTDLSDVAYSPTTVEVGETGVTLIGAVSGVNVQLLYTTTSTGTPASMLFWAIGPD